MSVGWKEFQGTGQVASEEQLAKLGLLIVDDECEIVESLGETFRGGFDILRAHSGQEALALFRAHAPKLILTDQRMPEMTGLELLREIKQINPAVIAIMVTGYSDIDVVIEAINTGLVWKYVTKPWYHEELRRLVIAAARKYLQDSGMDEARYRFPGVMGC